ncbi:MAG: glutathione S-transferase family protein [Rhodospirillaceae bacterium]|nr:glutathione S-transferase family protein [Rhodospirillaceae bacterium]
MITLYGKAASRTARNLWALEELGVPYKHVPYDYLKGETKTPEFLAINPAGKVPALTDGNVVMTESLGMNLYIAHTYGQGKLWPDDQAGRAKCIQWTLWAATELEPSAAGRLIQLVLTPEANRDAKAVEGFAEKSKLALNTLNAALTRSPYLAGNAFSVADLNVSAVTEYLQRTKFDLTPWPHVQKWLAECLSRPANQKVNEMKKAA